MSAEETPKQAAAGELQTFQVIRHEWYEVRYIVVYEVKAATHEEAVKELERYDETGSEDNCIVKHTMLTNGEAATEELPLETDETATVVLVGDANSYDERKKELPIKPVYNDVIYSEQLSFVLAYVDVGFDDHYEIEWLCLGIFRNKDTAQRAVKLYEEEHGYFAPDEVRYVRIAEGTKLPGHTTQIDFENEAGRELL